MPTSFGECRDDEFMLLPVDRRDWLPEDHLAYLIRDMVREMDLSPFYRRYAGDGRRNRPYEPRMMVTVLIYAYATGVFSSRRIVRKLHEDVAFRMLCGGSFPRHRTICEFRRRHLDDFRHLFLEVVRLAGESGMVRLGTVTVDGTKVRANASKRKAMSHGRMLKEERRLGARQRATDDAKCRKPGQDRNPRGGSRYKRPYGEPEATAQENFTDPESRIMTDKRRGLPAVLQCAAGG